MIITLKRAMFKTYLTIKRNVFRFSILMKIIEIFEIYVFLVKQEGERDVLEIFSTEVFLTGVRCGGRK